MSETPTLTPQTNSGARVDPVGAAVLWLSLLVYAASFLLPYGTAKFGAEIFLIGLLYCWMFPMTVAWWANVVYWVALANGYLGRWRRCAGLAFCAVLLALLHLLFIDPDAFASPAYHVWVGSMAVLCCSATVLVVARGRR